MKIEKKTPFEKWVISQKIYAVSFKFAWLRANGEIWLSVRRPRADKKDWVMPLGSKIRLGVWNGNLLESGLSWEKCVVALQPRPTDGQPEEVEEEKPKRKQRASKPLFEHFYEGEE